MSVRMEDWTTTSYGVSGIRLFGTVYGHPRIQDGHRTSTSTIVFMTERVARTESGTVYLLGRKKDDAVSQWKEDHGVTRVPGIEEAILGDR